MTAPASRIVTVDILRGLAIFIMVPANMAPAVYDAPHAFWFRLVTSFAAPIFIAVAGMMIALAAANKKHGWKHYVARGALLLLVAAMVDVLINKVAPFFSYDVLYLIGIACPLTYFFAGLGRHYQWSLIVLVFLATPILQWKFGYIAYPGDHVLWGDTDGSRQAVPAGAAGVLQRLLIDGWFPLFPWLGMSFVGAMIAQLFYTSRRGTDRRAIAAAVFLLAAGIATWWLDPGPMHDRRGFSELFYPPALGFIITACGAMLALLWVIDRAPDRPMYQPLRWLGECSLLMYVLHLAIIAYFLEPLFPGRTLVPFLLINFMTVFVLVGIAAAVWHMKVEWPDRSYLARFVFGG